MNQVNVCVSLLSWNCKTIVKCILVVSVTQKDNQPTTQQTRDAWNLKQGKLLSSKEEPDPGHQILWDHAQDKALLMTQMSPVCSQVWEPLTSTHMYGHSRGWSPSAQRNHKDSSSEGQVGRRVGWEWGLETRGTNLLGGLGMMNHPTTLPILGMTIKELVFTCTTTKTKTSKKLKQNPKPGIHGMERTVGTGSQGKPPHSNIYGFPSIKASPSP